MKSWILSTMAALALLMPQAQAQQRPTIGQLLEMCQSDADAPRAFCYGFLRGFVDGQLVSRQVSLCLSDGEAIRASQLAAVFVQWAEANSQFWHADMGFGVVAALSGTFLCAD